MKITISGTPGSGKSTLAQALVDHFTLERYYVGSIMRELGAKKGMDIVTYMVYIKDHPDEERAVDDRIKEIGKTQDDIIVEGRVAFLFIPDSIKLFVKVDMEEGVQRIFKELQEKGDRQNEKVYANYDEALEQTKRRHTADLARLRGLYGVNIEDESNYDIVIDTTGKNIPLVIDEAITRIEEMSRQRAS